MESNELNMDTETYLKVDIGICWEHKVSFILNSKASYVVGVMAF